MAAFKGYDSDTLFLLEENKFNDSKEHYESVKPLLHKKAIETTRLLCCELSERLYKIDPGMVLEPTKMVSRIRRDTRFSKTKNMYRSNVWTMFMRDKHQNTNVPCMWFEFMPGGYVIGVGMFGHDAAYANEIRNAMAERPSLFRSAVKKCERAGAVFDYEQYKRPKPGCPHKDLEKYYNCKYFYFIRYESDLTALFDGSILQIIEGCIDAYAPMYKFLLGASQRLVEKRGKNENGQASKI